MYDFIADPVGLHLYHCHTVPLKRHLHRGLYGAFIIDPRELRAPADELVMMLNGFDTNFDNENEVYAVNTIANAYMTDPIKVTVGRPVRIYVVNITEFDLINSFHLHGMFFDAYRTGTRGAAKEQTDTITLCQGERAILETTFRYPEISCFMRTSPSSPSLAGWACSGQRRRAVTPDASTTLAGAPPRERSSGALTWIYALVPIVLLGALLAAIVGLGPTALIQGNDAPPVERIAITRVDLQPDEIRLSVVNDGPDVVTIAQVAVDDAFWTFQIEPSSQLGHLQRGTIVIPYPWVHGDAHHVKLLTSTGVTFDHEIGVAVETPRPNARFFAVFAVIGLYVGVLPVAIGLLWYPLMSRLGRQPARLSARADGWSPAVPLRGFGDGRIGSSRRGAGLVSGHRAVRVRCGGGVPCAGRDWRMAGGTSASASR